MIIISLDQEIKNKEGTKSCSGRVVGFSDFTFFQKI